jgi:hypothetical protein
LNHPSLTLFWKRQKLPLIPLFRLVWGFRLLDLRHEAPGNHPRGFCFPVLKRWKNGRALSEFGQAYDFGRTMHVGGFGVSKRANPWRSLGAGTPRKPLGGSGGYCIGTVATAWPELPEPIKAGIVGMVKAARD